MGVQREERREMERVMPVKKIGTERGRVCKPGESITVKH